MLTYMWAMSAIKASILLFYYRLFNINRALRWTVYFTLCFVLGWHVSYFFALIFQCTPVAYFWDRSIPGGHCVDHGALNNNTLSVSNSAFNVFTDLMCLIAPLPVLIKLRLSKFKKAGLLLIFFLGGWYVLISYHCPHSVSSPFIPYFLASSTSTDPSAVTP